MERIASPRTDDQAVEMMIRSAGKTAPRITIADIEASIVSEHYFTADEGLVGSEAYDKLLSMDIDDMMDDESVSNAIAEISEASNNIPESLMMLTFCVLVLRNGFTVTGESACASPENFDTEIGRRIARENAIQKMWPLLGYELKSRLAGRGE